MKKITTPKRYRLAKPDEVYEGAGALWWAPRLKLWVAWGNRPLAFNKSKPSTTLFAIPKPRIRLTGEAHAA